LLVLLLQLCLLIGKLLQPQPGLIRQPYFVEIEQGQQGDDDGSNDAQRNRPQAEKRGGQLPPEACHIQGVFLLWHNGRVSGLAGRILVHHLSSSFNVPTAGSVSSRSMTRSLALRARGFRACSALDASSGCRVIIRPRAWCPQTQIGTSGGQMQPRASAWKCC